MKDRKSGSKTEYTPADTPMTPDMEEELIPLLDTPEGAAAGARKRRRRKLSKRIIALICVGAFIFVILAIAFGAWIAFLVVDNTLTIWSPDYDEVDISEILNKYLVNGEELTDDDYKTLYEQTGVTKIGVDRALEKGTLGKSRLLTIQEDYFTEHTIEHDKFAPYVCTDKLDSDYVQNIYLEPGDIFVTSSTHITGWKMGHAGIVTANGKVMQAMAYGTPTYEGSVSYFTNRVNYMILRPKTDDETRTAAADLALSLAGTEYNAIAGFFTPKDSVEYGTQCAHLVWYCYYEQGIDLDSDGSWLVTPNDIANSPNVELVQVFGFDPYKLWS
ncbi:MAG: hypothetical protein LUD48_01420 [Prevotella sp.]|nr:hypothetical protein [Prevotella sp.]